LVVQQPATSPRPVMAAAGFSLPAAPLFQQPAPPAPAPPLVMAAAGFAPPPPPPVLLQHHSAVPSALLGIPPGAPKVPMLLLDTTGSMAFPIAPGSPLPRAALARAALERLVAAVEARQGYNAPGLRAMAFANGAVLDMGYLRTPGFAQTWAALVWAGGTFVAPAIAAVHAAFAAEAPGGTTLALLLLTDGAPADLAALEAALARPAACRVLVGLLGYGEEHDLACDAYVKLASRYPLLKLVTFLGEESPDAIAATLARLLL